MGTVEGGDLVVRVLEEVRQIGQRLERFSTEVTGRFDGIDRRFDGIDRRFDGIDRRLDGIDHRIDGIDQRIEGLNERIDNTNDTLTLIGGVLQRAVSTVKERIDDHERRLRTIEGTPPHD